MFSARKTASSLLCLLSKRLENIPVFKENRFPLFLVELEIVLSSDDIIYLKSANLPLIFDTFGS